MTNVPATSPQRDTVICIGGRLHGTTVEIDKGAQTHVDLLAAETYYRWRDGFPYVQIDPANPRSVSLRKGYVADVLLHEDIANDMPTAHAWWKSLALMRMYEAHGRQLDQAGTRELMQKLAQGVRPEAGLN